MAKTKIVVIQMKEIIYTALLAGAGIMLIILLIIFFSPKKRTDETDGRAVYNAGTYTAQITLNNTALNLEVAVDPDRIKSVRLVNLSETVATMFPLLEPSLNQIEAQLKNNIAIDDIALSENSRYTQTLLIDAIKVILDKARIDDNKQQ